MSSDLALSAWSVGTAVLVCAALLGGLWVWGRLWRYTRHPHYFGDVCSWWGT